MSSFIRRSETPETINSVDKLVFDEGKRQEASIREITD
jgi:hypothetical protein